MKTVVINQRPVTLQMWDTAGQERYVAVGIDHCMHACVKCTCMAGRPVNLCPVHILFVYRSVTSIQLIEALFGPQYHISQIVKCFRIG